MARRRRPRNRDDPSDRRDDARVRALQAESEEALMPADFGTIHFSRRMMMRWAYRYGRDAGLPRYQAMIVATRSARPVTVDAMIGGSLAKSMMTTGPSAPYESDAGE